MPRAAQQNRVQALEPGTPARLSPAGSAPAGAPGSETDRRKARARQVTLLAPRQKIRSGDKGQDQSITVGANESALAVEGARPSNQRL